MRTSSSKQHRILSNAGFAREHGLALGGTTPSETRSTSKVYRMKIQSFADERLPRMRGWVLWAATLTALGCSANREPSAAANATRQADTSPVSASGRVRITRLGASDLPFLQSSGIDEELRTVIQSSAEFAAFWSRAHRRFGEQPASPAIDFEREMIIVAAMGTRPTGGYGIYIDSAAVVKGSFAVFVRSVRPGATCGTTAALTQPVDLARAPRIFLSAHFVESATTHECR